MKELVLSSLEEVDLLLYVMDLTRPPGKEEGLLASLAEGNPGRVVIALNKRDAVAKGPRRITSIADSVRRFAESSLVGSEKREVSALTGEGVDGLLELLLEKAPVGEQLYPEEIYTDQDPEFRCAEIIREKAIQKLRQEVPHAIYIEIADMELSAEGNKLWIRSFLHVERDSQKAILIGKGGSVVKSIRKESQRELEELFPYTLSLDLRVKVSPRWKRQDELLRRLIR